MDKFELRNYAKNIRKNLDIGDISIKLCNLIKDEILYQQSKHVMIYYPTKYEVNLLSLTSDNSKCFYLPKVNGNNLSVCPFGTQTKLELSKYSIYEPCSEPISPAIIDLVIAPALMCDKNNYRLGYGGGFYDRFLAEYKLNSICAIPSDLLVDKLPIEDFDIKIDKIITI